MGAMSSIWAYAHKTCTQQAKENKPARGFNSVKHWDMLFLLLGHGDCAMLKATLIAIAIFLPVQAVAKTCTPQSQPIQQLRPGSVQAVLCCCSIGNGQQCCGQTIMCGPIIPGCFCSQRHMEKAAKR